MSNFHLDMECERQQHPTPHKMNKITKQRSLMNQSAARLSAKKLKLFSMVSINPEPVGYGQMECSLGNGQILNQKVDDSSFYQQSKKIQINQLTQPDLGISQSLFTWDKLRKQADNCVQFSRREIILEEGEKNQYRDKQMDFAHKSMIDSCESVELNPAFMEEEETTTTNTAASSENSKMQIQDILEVPSFFLNGIDMEKSKPVSIFDETQISQQLGTHLQPSLCQSSLQNQQMQPASSWFCDVLPKGITQTPSPFKNTCNNNINNSIMFTSSQVASCFLKPIITSTNQFPSLSQNFIPIQLSSFSQQTLNNQLTNQQKFSFYSTQLPTVNMTSSINCSTTSLQQQQQQQQYQIESQQQSQFLELSNQQFYETPIKKPFLRLLNSFEPYEFSLQDEEEQSRHLENKINDWLDAEGVLQVEPNARRKISNSKNLSIQNPLTSSLIARRKLTNLSLH